MKLDNNGTSDHLLASWDPPEGEADYLLASLASSGLTLSQHQLLSNSTWVVFEGLTPGRSYELSVRTRAGGQSAEVKTQGRTGKDLLAGTVQGPVPQSGYVILLFI